MLFSMKYNWISWFLHIQRGVEGCCFFAVRVMLRFFSCVFRGVKVFFTTWPLPPVINDCSLTYTCGDGPWGVGYSLIDRRLSDKCHIALTTAHTVEGTIIVSIGIITRTVILVGTLTVLTYFHRVVSFNIKDTVLIIWEIKCATERIAMYTNMQVVEPYRWEPFLIKMPFV